MASLMEELLEEMEEEEKQYRLMIDLAEEKKQAIIKADLPKLETVNEQEQEISSEILNLSNKRVQILSDMATVLGKVPEEMTVTRMVGYLKNTPVEQERLQKRRDSLLEAGNRMHAANNQNEILLRQAMEMVEFDLTLLRSMKQAPETANYDKNAYNTGELLGNSGFDAKQ